MENVVTAGRKRVMAKTALVTVITGTLLFLTTACGSTTPAEPIVSSSPTTSTAASVAGSVVNGFATKKEVAEDSQGRKFVQTTLSPEELVFTYRPEITSVASNTLFTPEEIVAAQKEAVLFLAEEFTDSTLKGDNITKADKDLWWESAKEDIDPAQQQSFVDFLAAPYNAKEPTVYENPERAANGYALVYDENDIQIASRDITVTGVIAMQQDGKKYVGFAMDIYFELPVVKNGETALEKVSASGEIATTQTSPGVFKISGITLAVDSVTYSK